MAIERFQVTRNVDVVDELLLQLRRRIPNRFLQLENRELHAVCVVEASDIVQIHHACDGHNHVFLVELFLARMGVPFDCVRGQVFAPHPDLRCKFRDDVPT